MKVRLLFLVLSMFFSILPISVLAQGLSDWYNIDYLWRDVFGLDPSWQQPRLLIFNFILPFIALFAVILGMLKNLRIFPRTPWIEGVIAFVMAFSTLPSKIFIIFVAGSLAFAGGFAYVVFLLMFIFGSAIFGAGFLHREYGTMSAFSGYRKDMDRLDSEIKNTIADMNDARQRLLTASPGDVENIEKKLRRLDMHHKELQARKTALMNSYRGGQ